MRVGVLLAVVGALLGAATPAAAREPLSGRLLLERLTDASARLTPLPGELRPVMVSSHDRTGGNLDGGSYGGAFAAFSHPPAIVRRDGAGYVLYEARRPGCLLRTFMGAAGPLPGSTQPWGRLQVVVDGELRFDEDAVDFFDGRVARYPKPLVADFEDSSGASYAMVPICFAHSVVVRTTSAPPDGLGWWQLGLVLGPAGTPVEPSTGREDLGWAAERLRLAAAAPPGEPQLGTARKVAAGETVELARLRGAGTLRHLRLRVAPFDTATLRSLSVRVTVDGAREPQIDVPLLNLFGDGVEVKRVAATAFGMAPNRREGYFSLPIPYRRGAVVTLAAGRPAEVGFNGWTARRAPVRAGVLFGRHHTEETVEGRDSTVIDARGSGRLAAIVLDVLRGEPGTGVKGLEFFLEGDERVHVDGVRSPAMYGTGHEEVSNGGFYFGYGPFTRELGGAGPLGTGPDGGGTLSQYRVFADEGPRWSSAIRFGIEHGGGDEQDALVGATTWSYRRPATLRRTDAVRFDDGSPLTGYFEGDRDGNGTTSTVVVGGSLYPAPDAADSPEGLTARGASFTEPLSLQLTVGRCNRGVVLRGLFDQAEPLVPLRVEVDGRFAGIWQSPDGVPNPSKRWLEDDLDLPPSVTDRRRRRVRVTLTPEGGRTAHLYGLEAWTRACRL